MINSKIPLFSLTLMASLATPAWAAPLKILTLGDSITAGSHNGGNHLAYRDDLYNKLKYAGYTHGTDYEFVGSLSETVVPALPLPVPVSYDGVELVHEGHSSMRADDMYINIEPWASNYDVDIVLLHAGTNDLNQNANGSETKPDIDADTLNDLENIINELAIQEPGVAIFVAKLIPHLGTGVDITTGLNALITPAWATAQEVANAGIGGANISITVVDHHTGMASPVDYNSDQVHPNQSGEAKMADNWYDAIESLLPAVTVANPPVTAGLTVHLDAADINGDDIPDVVVNNTTTSTWNNKADGNDLTLVAGTVAADVLGNATGLNSKPVVEFTNTGLETASAGQITSNTSYTKFAVVSLDNFGTKNNIIASRPLATTLSTQNTSTYSVRAIHDTVETGAEQASGTVDLTARQFARIAFRYDPTTLGSTIYLNGAAGSTETTEYSHLSSGSKTSIGSIENGNYLNGKIAEVLVYDRELSDIEMVEVDTYLNEKWFGVLPGSSTPTLAITSAATSGVGGSYTATSTSTSGGAITYSVSPANICSVTGDQLTLIATGTCTLTADQVTSGVYAAASTTLDIDVSALSQTLVFTPPATKAFGAAPFTVSATSFKSDGFPTTLTETGLAASISVDPSSVNVCSIDSATNAVTLLSSGSCTLKATQSGNASYAATEAEATIAVAKADQNVTLTIPSSTAVIGTSFNVSASTTSDLTEFTIQSTTTGICTVSGATVTPVAAGACKLTATQAGDGRYNADTSTAITVTVSAIPLTAAEEAMVAVVQTIANGTAITNTQLALVGLTSLETGIDYAAALKAGTYADRAKPTTAELQAVINKANSDAVEPTEPTDDSGSGGGSTAPLGLMLLGLAGLIRRKLR